MQFSTCEMFCEGCLEHEMLFMHGTDIFLKNNTPIIIEIQGVYLQ